MFVSGTDFLLKKWIYFLLIKSRGYSIPLPHNLDVYGFSFSPEKGEYFSAYCNKW